MSALIFLFAYLIAFTVMSLFIVVLDEIDAPFFTPLAKLLRRVV